MALARALAREPAVLLLDEPFAAVDRPVRRRLQDEIDALRRTLDIPLILVTHDFDDVVRLATHVLILERGQGIAWGPVTELMSRPDLAWLRDAVGLGSVFDATVSRVHPDRGLVELRVRRRHAAGVRSPGRAVGAAFASGYRHARSFWPRSAPAGLSLHNVLAGTVSALHNRAGVGPRDVQVAVGGVRLLAEVTRDAVERLGIVVGMPSMPW